MRKIITHILSFVLLANVFISCSTDVDLYADYKDITVVYGLLDPGKDTNFVKINKAFLGPGNAFEIAMIADSCNYPNKLDATITEYRSPVTSNNYQATKTFSLDTITIHTKEPGTFYAPDQLVYYTTQPIRVNKDSYKYKYELQIDRGDTILKAETSIVGGSEFAIDTKPLGFSSDKGTIKWRPCPNASVYEVVIKFYFTEIGPTHDSIHRCMSWSLGTHPTSSLTEDNGKYVINYKSAVFYTTLASFLGNDTLKTDVERVVKDPCLGVSISAGGEELYNFIAVNGPSNSIVQSIPEYTNISGGGYGVFSSRAQKEQMVRMSSFSDLTKEHENWRFRQGK